MWFYLLTLSKFVSRNIVIIYMDLFTVYAQIVSVEKKKKS